MIGRGGRGREGEGGVTLFFLSDQIGQIKEISQSADFSLAELEKKELIKYSQIDGQKNNTINNNKYPYKVTLINQIRID